MACGSKTDFIFPIEADIFYPIVEQADGYGQVKKHWILDKTAGFSLSSGGSAMKEDITPNVNITQQQVLIGRVREDLRVSSREAQTSITNIVIANIRDKNCNIIYSETAGPRAGKSTIFEVASIEPFVGPFGSVEYFSITLRRSENQAVDL